MRKTLLYFTILTLLCGLLPAAALAQSAGGQRYDTFLANYSADITFINENDNRHLLPLVIAKRKSDQKDGRLFYEIFGDVLSLTVQTDPTGEFIETCQITLTAPQGIEYGNSLYNDFAISGYHSYALLMAMHTAADAAQRYELVNTVVKGMGDTNGNFTMQVGIYSLVCARVNNVATLTFENSRLGGIPDSNATTEPGATFGSDEAAAPGIEQTEPPAQDEDNSMGLG